MGEDATKMNSEKIEGWEAHKKFLRLKCEYERAFEVYVGRYTNCALEDERSLINFQIYLPQFEGISEELKPLIKYDDEAAEFYDQVERTIRKGHELASKLEEKLLAKTEAQ